MSLKLIAFFMAQILKFSPISRKSYFVSST
jgi:hypothetical protein